MVGIGYWALIDNMRQTRKVFRRQNRLLVIGTLVPLLVNFGYIFFDWRPYGHLDLTPFAFLFTSFIIAIGLLRFGLFDISPMARSRVISELSDGVVVLDAFQRIIDYNDAFYELVAQQNDDLIGRDIHDLISDSKFPADLLEDEVLTKRALMIRSSDDRHFELSITGLYEKSGMVNGAALIFKDVSERIQAQSELLGKTMELERLNDLKDRLFSIIAHDLRAPLLNLQEVMSLVNTNVLDEEERKELFKALKQNVDQSVSLMQNLLAWASSQQKGERIHPSPFKLKEMVEEVGQGLQAILAKKSIQLQIELEDDIEVYADREMIQIVIRNLISNAIKFTSTHGEIKVKSRTEANSCIISVNDNGEGIAPEILKTLRAEKRVTAVGTAQEQGSGLGLMLCRDFISKNGGKLQIESTAGQGSSFSFNLPLQGTS